MTCPTCEMQNPNATAIKRARALMCQCCIYADFDMADPWGMEGGGAVECRISGKPVRDHVVSCKPSCPRGKHGDAAGLVRFFGIRWMGAPAPIRWVLFWWLTGPLPGCGCIYRVKSWWMRRKMSKGVGYAVSDR